MAETAQSSNKFSAASMSVAASGFMVVGKFAVALLTGSLGALSESLHSLIDLGATVITWFAVRWADQPADDDHHFGHAKIESLAALFESGLLMLTALWVAYEAVRRLMAHVAPPVVTWWALAILAAAIAIDFNRAAALRHTAEAEHSEALAADAAHFQSDMLGSAAVLAGLVATWAGWAGADAIAALFVSFFIGWISYKLAGDTVSTLLDKAPEGMQSAVRQMAMREAGLLKVSQLRLRKAGRTTYVDLLATVPRSMPLHEMTSLRDRLVAKIDSLPGEIDSRVTIEPVALDTESAAEKASAIALERGLLIHHLLVQDISGNLAVSFDVEMDGTIALGAAHDKATELEDAIRNGLGGNVEVDSHIEPKPIEMMSGQEASRAQQIAASRLLKKLSKEKKLISGVHNIRLRKSGASLFLHYHCRFAPDVRLELCHDVLDKIEAQMMSQMPELTRVVAHAEPLDQLAHRL